MRFEDLKLAIGTNFNLIIVGQNYKEYKCRALLVGYQKNKRLMIELIEKPPQVFLHKGLKIDVSINNALGHAKFASKIEDVDESTTPYLVLPYPNALDFKKIRSQPRLPISSPVEVTGKEALGGEVEPIKGHMVDVSSSGGRIVMEKKLNSMLEGIDVGFFLSMPGLERDLNLSAQICQEAKLSPKFPNHKFSYGIQFVGLELIDQYFLQAFCAQTQLQS